MNTEGKLLLFWSGLHQINCDFFFFALTSPTVDYNVNIGLEKLLSTTEWRSTSLLANKGFKGPFECVFLCIEESLQVCDSEILNSQ